MEYTRGTITIDVKDGFSKTILVQKCI
jgi:hypothetical protein